MEKTIRQLSQRDKEMVLEYLNRNHIETTFLIGNVLEFGLDNDLVRRRCADYFGYFEDEALKGILSFYNLGSCIPHYESADAISFFVNLLKDREFEVLLGMANVIAPLYEALKEFKQAKNYSDDGYYTNEQFIPFQLVNVRLRLAKEIPTAMATEFLLEVRNTGFGEHVSREEIEKQLEESVPEEERIFVLKDGVPVAHAVIQATTSRVNQIGGVYTSEHQRGNGYAKAAVSELCRIITNRGKLPTLMVRKNNTPAVRAYEALGFRFFKDYLIIAY